MNRPFFSSEARSWVIDPGKIAAGLLLFAVAFGLKYHYSHATSEDLAWVLKPTATLVMYLSDLTFVSEAHTGFISRSGRIIIAPSCAGINFMIVALLMAGSTGIFRLKTGWRIPVWLGVTGISAYGLTLAVNAIRIVGAIRLYTINIYQGWLTPALAHRLEGVGVYFLALCLSHLATQYLLTIFLFRSSLPRKIEPGIRPFIGLAPVIWYFLIILGIPLVNRTAAHDPARFIEHSLTVVIGSGLVLFALFLVRSVITGGHRVILPKIKNYWPVFSRPKEMRQ